MGNWAEYMGKSVSAQYGEDMIKAAFSGVSTSGPKVALHRTSTFRSHCCSALGPPQITESHTVLESRVFIAECLCECFDHTDMQVITKERLLHCVHMTISP